MAVQPVFHAARGDHARQARDHGHEHGFLVHVHGEGAVPLADDAVLPDAHAVVAGEDHQRVFAQMQFLQGVEQLADALVHAV